ncbi:low-density lipoprotein receptor-like isoform X4 [Rana temporaria]|uniref:low-density lipoprotein receptor-like isoform X4 n=1 Tax=Rana temporaria TaxID=8407 RepID=UPI001AAD941E|nr:low-density lipoprotein receptor-like isoform X4 [Rana temporaria]
MGSPGLPVILLMLLLHLTAAPPGKSTCSPDQFQCNDGKCINRSLRCNQEHDCDDLTDEIGCVNDKPTCSPDQFKCNDGKCINVSLRCNGEHDCDDHSDEIGCVNESRACKSTEFSCGGRTNLCIPLTWKCDHNKDCEDGSDEKDCVNVTNMNASEVRNYRNNESHI